VKIEIDKLSRITSSFIIWPQVEETSVKRSSLPQVSLVLKYLRDFSWRNPVLPSAQVRRFREALIGLKNQGKSK